MLECFDIAPATSLPERNLPMPIRPSFRPHLDILEDRSCPSVTLLQQGPNMVITGTPSTSLAGLTITGAGGTNYIIKDGLQDFGTYAISGNLTLDLKHYTSPIILDLNGQALSGNVLFEVGAGNVLGLVRPISIVSSTTGGTIDGSVKLVGGSGNETLDIGSTNGTEPVNINGSVIFDGNNAPTGNNNTLAISDGSSVGVNVSASLVPNVQIGASGGMGAFIGHNLTVDDSGSRYEVTVGINQDSEVGGNVRVVGTSRPIASGDSFVVQPGAIVVGALTANLGTNTNLWKLGGTFDGAVRLVGGGGGQPAGGSALNTIELDDGAQNPGTFHSSVTAITGSGSTAFVFNPLDKITGNLNLIFGNGTNDLGGGNFGGVFEGTVVGNISITLGNGANSAVIGTAPDGKLTWNSGAGDSNLTLGSDLTHANTFWRVNAHFGDGSNDFILDPNAPQHQYLSGRLSGENGADLFTNDGLNWVISTAFAVGKLF
jgi:hypothetical protein